MIGERMIKKLLLWCGFVVIASAHVSREQLLTVIKNGTLTHEWLCNHDVGIDQLNEVITPLKETPLIVAMRARLLHTVDVLLEAGVDVTSEVDGDAPIDIAARESTIEIFKHVLRAGAHITHAVCEYAPKKHDLFFFLIRLFEPLYVGSVFDGNNAYNLTSAQAHTCLNRMLLHVADEHELDRLLKFGADPAYRDEQGWAALDYALAEGRWRLVTILRSQGAQPATSHAIEQAQLLLQSGIDQIKGDDCMRALRAAYGEYALKDTYNQFIEHINKATLTKAFLKKYFTGINKLHINRSFAQRDNQDALLLALCTHQVKTVRLLLCYGAHVHPAAFIYALQHCSKEMVRLLIEHGAHLSWVQRPLEFIMEQHNPHAQELIAWLAPQTMRVRRNQALCYAQDHGYTAIAQILEDNKARC